MKVLIVGGGVIGLMTARELIREGIDVVVVERGQIGKEASWAGGGIVSPLYPWRYSAAVTALSGMAQSLYPALAEALWQESGINPEYYPCGMLMLDPDDEAAAVDWSRNNHREHRLLESQDLAGMGYRSPGFRRGLWLPGIANIRNPRLMASLRASLVAHGAEFREAATVVGWDREAGRLGSVRLASGERLHADAFILAAGAWSGGLLTQLDIQLPVEPVKGQMLLYRAEPGVLTHIALHQGHYVIPRMDGHILCGSTLEHTGFLKESTPDALAMLSGVAESLVPALRGMKPVAHWAGLRPGAPDGIPFIGRVEPYDNLWINTGQFRNGLVLAPASARLLSALMTGRPPEIDPSPYSPSLRRMA
ncbi:glycine oxidase [Fluviicoccus keumensis]|uniref:Glycine oxidase n=1 Tax=Fluviicoccus keumensis TaxID=1435465 RepID=A0A4Q7ZC89_9GAMM|nr:glycine oxidase ThiO [Fluviicoccus keumensis]RZU47479.1 glycine oxidase [Fluviicoccus keumensis]